MSLRVYNTLSGEKEVFTPVVPGKVSMYLCGPTVYKESHLGHAVGPIIFDTIKSYLTYKGFQVTFVVNITDVEDKLIDAAKAQQMGVYELAEEVTRKYRDALAQLSVNSIDHMPRASEHIREIIDMTQTLIDKGYAYESQGDVYFDVAHDEDYGKLSNRNPEDQSGQRELVGQQKRNPGDFTLWKAAKPDEPEEVCFESPWGRGRPGWHIECSAMSTKFLGKTFDFHGGGMDLIFPHHENEIAQSESATGQPFAKYWLHNGLTRMNTKKVSKSDQSQEMVEAMKRLTLSNILTEFNGEFLRYFVLSTHYRRPIEFTDEELEARQKGLDSFYRLFDRVKRATGSSPYEMLPTLHKPRLTDYSEKFHQFINDVLQFRTDFLDAMDDDFNTANAIAVLFKLGSSVNKMMDEHQVEISTEKESRSLALAATRTLIEDARILGLFQRPVVQQGGSDQRLSTSLDLLVTVRNEAKADKNFALADKIRDELAAIGVKLEDSKDGTHWRLDG